MCVITKTLFGEDADDQAYAVSCEREDGSIVDHSLFEAIRVVSHEQFVVGVTPLNMLFPFIQKHNIGT